MLEKRRKKEVKKKPSTNNDDSFEDTLCGVMPGNSSHFGRYARAMSSTRQECINRLSAKKEKNPQEFRNLPNKLKITHAIPLDR